MSDPIHEALRGWHNNIVDPTLIHHNQRLHALETHITNCPHNPDYYMEEFTHTIQSEMAKLQAIVKHVQEFEIQVYERIKTIEKRLVALEPHIPFPMALDIDIPKV